jgi:UDP-glucose 4-epimerase
MVQELLDGGEDITVIENLSTGFRSAVPEQVRFVEGNAGDMSLVGQLLRDTPIDAILHFAGSIVVPGSVTDPLGYCANNTCNSRNLLACAVDVGVPNLIFSSTAAVYGQPKRFPAVEEAPLQPISPYRSAKLMTETMLADTARASALCYVALRYFKVAGADPQGRTGQSTPRATHLIKVACEAALGLRAGLDIFGTDDPTSDGTCERDYTQLTDLVRAHLGALRYLQGGAESAVLNCGYGWASQFSKSWKR